MGEDAAPKFIHPFHWDDTIHIDPKIEEIIGPIEDLNPTKPTHDWLYYISFPSQWSIFSFLFQIHPELVVDPYSTCHDDSRE